MCVCMHYKLVSICHVTVAVFGIELKLLKQDFTFRSGQTYVFYFVQCHCALRGIVVVSDAFDWISII